MSAKKKVVVLDGGTGFSLAEAGHKELETDSMWSALLVKTDPKAVVDLHKQFYRCGADVVVTATYQASVEGYVKKFGVSRSEALGLVNEGVTLARQARDQMQRDTGRTFWVAGSVGPYGATLCDLSEYHGRYAENMTLQELSEWHSGRLAAIVAGQPDLLAVETIPVVKEAQALLEALKAFPQARAWVSFQCKDGQHTGHGEPLAEALRVASQSDQVVAVGVNCTSPQYIAPLLQSVAHLNLQLPILVKPNKGGLSGEAPSTASLGDLAREWLDLGATWLGGCCYYGPRDVTNLRMALESQPDVELLGLTL